MAYPQTHTGNVRIQTPRPHLGTCKPVSKGSRERAIKLVGGTNEMHVGANPKQSTNSANGIANHYRNIICLEGKTREGIAYPQTHTGNVRKQKPGPHLRTCKPASKGSRGGAMEIVCGGNEVHVGGNPLQSTNSANGSPNHYGNIKMSRKETRDGMAEPHNSVDKTRTNAHTQALTKGKLFEGS